MKTCKLFLRLRLHVTETKSHPEMKKFLFTRKFHPRMKRVEVHPGMKFNLKNNLPLSIQLDTLNHQTITFQKSNFVHHFRLLLLLLRHFRSSRPEVFCKKAGLQQKETLAQVLPCEFCKISKNTPFFQNTSGGCFWHFQTWCCKIQRKIEIIVRS